MKRAFLVIFMAAITFTLGGCVVDDEEYETARRGRDDYLNQLKELNEANEQLNREISTVYAEYEELSGRLAMHAAVDLHAGYVLPLITPQPQTPPGGQQTQQRNVRRNRPSGTYHY